MSKEENANIYFSFLKKYAQQLKEQKKGIVYIGKNFLFGLVGEKDAINANELKVVLATEEN